MSSFLDVYWHSSWTIALKYIVIQRQKFPLLLLTILCNDMQKYTKLYVFKVDTTKMNRMSISVCRGTNVYLIYKSFNKTLHKKTKQQLSIVAIVR